MLNENNGRGDQLKKLFTFQWLIECLEKQSLTNHTGGGRGEEAKLSAQIEHVRPISYETKTNKQTNTHTYWNEQFKSEEATYSKDKITCTVLPSLPHYMTLDESLNPCLAFLQSIHLGSIWSSI